MAYKINSLQFNPVEGDGIDGVKIVVQGYEIQVAQDDPTRVTGREPAGIEATMAEFKAAYFAVNGASITNAQLMNVVRAAKALLHQKTGVTDPDPQSI